MTGQACNGPSRVATMRVSKLREAAERHREERAREEARRLAVERARKQAAAAKARAKYRDELATRQEAAWKRAEALIDERRTEADQHLVNQLVAIDSDRFQEPIAMAAGRCVRRGRLQAR